jgi:hydrogenase expression/formation protein HypD
MDFLADFRRPDDIKRLAGAVTRRVDPSRDYVFMEVCGTHTMAIGRYGLRRLLPDNVRLISGPGCPVCVTPQRYVDTAIALAQRPDTAVFTFGDMMRVPGSSSTLSRAASKGGTAKVVYSPNEAVSFASENTETTVVFLGVGFETTTPAIAGSIALAQQIGLDNYRVLAAHKLIPPALEALCSSPNLSLDGFILPAHVSAIIGSNAYEPVIERYNVAGCITGFEPSDVMQGVLQLVRQVNEDSPRVENEYARVVKPGGNRKAQQLVAGMFKSDDTEWRGIGVIPQSGMNLRPEYRNYNAYEIAVEVEPTKENAGCRCGEILTGSILPGDCPLFGEVCTPENPVGACMVSSEGTCAAYYKYREV